MRALRIEREPLRFAAARLAGAVRPGSGAGVGPLRLVDTDPPELPGPDWVRIRPRLAGICGSDLATIDATSSRWFEPVVSFPFVPGHEVVADDERGRRVVLEPVLGCVARGRPPCRACAAGDLGRCGHLAEGTVDAGLQSGFCCDTGGGWSTEMVAHPSQLHEVPDELDDRAAVLVEPTACALHGALRAQAQPDETAVVIGAGTLGLGVLAALARWSPPGRLVAVAKHPHQRDLVDELAGPHRDTTEVCTPAQLLRTVRRLTGSMLLGEPGSGHERLSGGADLTVDCVGSPASLAAAMAVTRPGGRVVLVGMPGVAVTDLTPLWQRELAVLGAYAYGTEVLGGSRFRTFDLSAELVAAAGLGRLVSATYPLERHPDAVAHAAAAGRRGATKVAFDLHDPDHPPRPVLRGRR